MSDYGLWSPLLLSDSDLLEKRFAERGIGNAEPPHPELKGGGFRAAGRPKETTSGGRCRKRKQMPIHCFLRFARGLSGRLPTSLRPRSRLNKAELKIKHDFTSAAF